ncbi:MAG: ribosome silencing factor [Elusimicrobia bacterium]|nr:ribosome silencing factor [Elusimicrobiota bacterium]
MAGRRFKSIAILAAKAADEKKGERISLLCTSRRTILMDYLLIVSADSPAHLDTLEHKISSLLKEKGLSLLHHDGSRSDVWRVLDYGGLLIHLLHPEARDFYGIDKLYRDAPRIHWHATKKTAARR